MNAKALFSLLWFGLAVSSQAQTFTLGPSADTTLRSGTPNQNRGGEPVVQFFPADSRILMRFDQAAIASAVGSGRLVSASLELYVRSAANNWATDGRPVEAHRVSADWTEAGTTWNCGIDTQPTNTSANCVTQWNGGTFEEDSTDTISQTNEEHRWVQFDVTSDVAAFLAGTPNRGWLLKRSDEDPGGQVEYASREGAAAERPRLVLLVETAANDQVPPSLKFTAPNRSILINEPSPTVTVEYADGGGGVDTATFQLLVDGQDATSSCNAGAQSASCHPPTLTAGHHTLQARLRDHAGNQAQASFSFQLLLGSGPHLATFQAVGDTFLRKGAANQNQGMEPILRLREGGDNRALVRFDPQSLATTLSGATLVSASLEVHIESNGRNWGKTGRMVDIHRLTATWTEPGATWNCPDDSVPSNHQPDCASQWNGGVFALSPTASVLHTRELAGWVSFDVTADVAAFLSGTPNHGWLLKKTDEKKSGRVEYDSRQGTGGEGPRLVVVFQTAGGGTDTTPPSLAITSPAAGAVVTDSTPGIAFTWSDVGTGADPATLVAHVSGVPIALSCTFAANGAICEPLAPLPDGPVDLTATIADGAGNVSLPASVLFTIDTETQEPSLPPDPATVAPALDPTVPTDMASATAFLYTGDDPIQTGVTPGTIEARRVAVLRGRVLVRDGDVLPGVRISILGHSEFGHTLSRADGTFDLAVNGGGVVTVQYEKAGYLGAQRQIAAPWRDYASMEDVVLVQLDAEATPVATGSPDLQIARGSVVEDEDGERQATLLFAPGFSVEMVKPDGSRVPLSTLTVRATEYTIGESGPKAMPAPLPAASGYTYAVELSADEAIAAGATRVDFSQPVVFYLENFLDFPVGGIVPAGYYDRQKAAWLPSQNGRIVKLLSVTAGLADLDLDGSGVPTSAAALSALGVSEAERRELATLYAPGQSLWRVPISHFTPWDCNWPYGPPSDATEPPDPKKEEDDEGDEDEPCTQSGSVIECENQILGENVPVVGTPFSLHYRSDRVPGRLVSRTVKVLLSEGSVPASLRRIDLHIDVAGRRFSQSFSPAPNLTHSFTWDGKDAYGRTVQGKRAVTISIGYVYGAVYYDPAQIAESFASFSPDLAIVTDRLRAEVTFWRQHQRTVGAWDARAAGLGGWDFDIHHTYDPSARLLLLGDGTRRGGDDLNRQMDRVPYSSATNSTFDVEVGTDGSIYALDYRPTPSFPLYNISTHTPDGQFRSFQVSMSDPVSGIGVAPDGTVYYAQCRGFSGNFVSQVWRLPPDWNRTLALGPDQVRCPEDIVVEPDGSLLIADSGLQKILRVRPGSTATTVAGSSDPAAPDSGPASQVRFDLVGARLALGADGTIYLSEAVKHRIRRIGPDGQVVTIAGTGTSGFTPDGAPAVAAQIRFPAGLTVARDGSVLFAESSPPSQRIRRITPSGILVTEAGGTSGISAGGPQPPSAPIQFPNGVALHQDGEMFISLGDPQGRRIRPSSTAFSLQEVVLASPDGRSVFVFDREGRHLSTRDALTGATLYRFTYDSLGSLATVEDDFSNVTRIERDALGRPTAIVAPFGQRTELALDASGFLSSIKNPASEETRFSYTSDGLLMTMTDPRDATAEYSYSVLGRLSTAEDRADGLKQLLRFPSASGYEALLTSPLGRETRYRREDLADGRIIRSTTSPAGFTVTSTRSSSGAAIAEPSGAVSTTLLGADPRFGMQAPFARSFEVRTPSGLTLSATSTRTATLANASDPLSPTTLEETFTTNGRTDRRVYNASQRKFAFTSAAGRTSTTTLDAFGRPVLFEAGGLAPMSFAYDSRGRLSAITQGSGTEERTLTLAYGTAGWLSEALGPLAYRIGFEQDAAGRLLRQTLPGAQATEFSYDPNGNLATLTPPARPSHSFGYTPLDLPSEYAPPLLGSEPNRTTYSYNLDRQLTRISRPDSRIVDRIYSDEGRLQAIGFSVGQIGLSYHPTTGNLSGVNAPGESVAYSYDGFLLTGTIWSGTVTGSVTRTYNADFRVATLRVNGANPITFQYDADGLVSQAGALTLARSSQSGLLTGTTLGQVTTTQNHNTFGELAGFTASYQGTPLSATTYTRDKLGRIIQKVETVGGTTDTFDYTYDSSGRLTDVGRNGLPLSHYDYDGNGNRMAHTSPSGTVAATYDAQDRLLSYGDKTFAYSANGELASKSQNSFSVTYDYDEFGNLRRVVLPEGITIEYVIDGQNRRVGKKVNGTLSQGFLYQGGLQPIAELDGSGAVVSRFIYGSRTNIPDYMVKGGATYRILSDHLGSPRLIVNTATGQTEQRMDFDEYGRAVFDSNPGFQPFGFGGGVYDHQTKLVRFGARDYDPEVGRWTAKDPILFAGQDTDLYAYVASDPVNFSDIFGLARVTNNSGVPIPYKPENEDNQPPRLIPPGGTGEADGVYSPANSKNPRCVKIPDNCSATVQPNGQLAVKCDWRQLDERGRPRVVTPEDLQGTDFRNWPDPYSGRNWPYPVWPRP